MDRTPEVVVAVRTTRRVSFLAALLSLIRKAYFVLIKMLFCDIFFTLIDDGKRLHL
jgi:hypothetical protein